MARAKNPLDADQQQKRRMLEAFRQHLHERAKTQKSISIDELAKWADEVVQKAMQRFETNARIYAASISEQQRTFVERMTRMAVIETMQLMSIFQSEGCSTPLDGEGCDLRDLLAESSKRILTMREGKPFAL